MKRQSFVTASLGLIAPFALAARAAADVFPAKPIQVIVPWPERGIVDVITRTVMTKLSADWGKPIDVQDQVGGDGARGTKFVAGSAPDGYTWLIGTLTTITAPYVVKNIYPNPLDAFSGVAMLAASSLVAVVPSSLPVKSLKEFVALAKSQPGKLTYVNPGKGSASYLNCELLNEKEHINIVAVDYNGQPIAVPDLVLGYRQFGLLAPALAAQMVQAGRLRPLAVAFPKRIPQFPNVPTFAEAGFPDVDVVASFYILVPKRTPPDIRAQISNAVTKATADPAVRKKIEAAGGDVLAAKTPREVDALLVADNERWSRFFKARNVVPE